MPRGRPDSFVLDDPPMASENTFRKETAMLDGLRPCATFMNIATADNFQSSQAVIVGIPFDCGAHRTRVGARLGPAAIRALSLDRERGDEWSDIDAIELLNLRDAGDIIAKPGDIEISYRAIEKAIFAIASQGAIPIALGGDGATALPQMRALHRVYPDLVTIHLDSHTDAYPVEPFDNSNAFLHAAREKVVDTSSSFQIGMRGTASAPAIMELGRKLGYQVIPQREFLATGFGRVAESVRAQVGNRPLYLNWDMDFFDPSCAPAVCTPTPGGLTAREGLAFLQELHGIVAVDVNTVSPPQDPAGVTALLASNLIQNIINLIARDRLPRLHNQK